MYQNHSDFVSSDDIEAWCYSPKPCEYSKLCNGVNGRKYVYCLKYKNVVWKILTLCKEDIKNNQRVEKLNNQKTLEAF